jgi:hypothetical protein
MLKYTPWRGSLWILLQIHPLLLEAFKLASEILLGLTSMTTILPTISPFGIDGNTHTPPMTIDTYIFMLSPPVFILDLPL